jgi:hypothetical protein
LQSGLILVVRADSVLSYTKQVMPTPLNNKSKFLEVFQWLLDPYLTSQSYLNNHGRSSIPTMLYYWFDGSFISSENARRFKSFLSF